MNKQKFYFNSEHFEYAINDIKNRVLLNVKKDGLQIVSVFKDGLPLGVRLSNEFNTGLSIINYEKFSSNSDSVTLLKDDGLRGATNILIVSDLVQDKKGFEKIVKYIKEKYDKEPIIYTLFGDPLENNTRWNFTFKENGQKIQFIPWVGMDV